jgi:hypothetical protein
LLASSNIYGTPNDPANSVLSDESSSSGRAEILASRGWKNVFAELMSNFTGSFGWFQTLLEEIEAAQADCEL